MPLLKRFAHSLSMQRLTTCYRRPRTCGDGDSTPLMEHRRNYTGRVISEATVRAYVCRAMARAARDVCTSRHRQNCLNSTVSIMDRARTYSQRRAEATMQRTIVMALKLRADVVLDYSLRHRKRAPWLVSSRAPMITVNQLVDSQPAASSSTIGSSPSLAVDAISAAPQGLAASTVRQWASRVVKKPEGGPLVRAPFTRTRQPSHEEKKEMAFEPPDARASAKRI